MTSPPPSHPQVVQAVQVVEAETPYGRPFAWLQSRSLQPGGTLGNCKIFCVVPKEVLIHKYCKGPPNYNPATLMSIRCLASSSASLESFSAIATPGVVEQILGSAAALELRTLFGL